MRMFVTNIIIHHLVIQVFPGTLGFLFVLVLGVVVFAVVHALLELVVGLLLFFGLVNIVRPLI